MTKDKVPEAFGVFKPVGHVVVTFSFEKDREGAAQALKEAGFRDNDLTWFSAQEMKSLTEGELSKAGPLASLGVDKALVERYARLAEENYCWLIVYAPEPGQAQQVADIVKRFRADQAQKYGQMVIEELL
jgi:hypothetical protein